jgi:hypothetical protein
LQTDVPDFLTVTNINIVLELVRRAEVAIHILADKDRLNCCESEHNSRGQKTIDHSKTDLD